MAELPEPLNLGILPSESERGFARRLIARAKRVNWFVIDGLKRYGFADHAQALTNVTIGLVGQSGFRYVDRDDLAPAARFVVRGAAFVGGAAVVATETSRSMYERISWGLNSSVASPTTNSIR